jgi:hypothetical protein
MENQTNPKILDVTSGDAMHAWVKTLSSEEQQTWQTAHEIHQAVVEQAIVAGDAVLGNGQIIWPSMEIHKSYLDQIDSNSNEILIFCV